MQRVRNLARRRQDAGAEYLDPVRLLDQTELDAEPAKALERQNLSAVLGRRRRLADQHEELGIILIEQGRHVAEAVMDHVRFRRELRVRAVSKELRHWKAALGDVLVEDPVG